MPHEKTTIRVLQFVVALIAFPAIRVEVPQRSSVLFQAVSLQQLETNPSAAGRQPW
jgi:hypothetical protein